MLWKQDVGSKQSLFHPISGFGIQFETISPSLHTTFPISTFSNTGKVSLWFSSFAETTFDFPSKQYQITVTSKPLIFKVSGRKLGNSIPGIELVELVVLWKYHILMWCELSLVSFLHRSILSTGKNCWTEVTYFKDRTTHCTYQIALNRFFSQWWKAKKDCEDEDILISHFVRGWSGPDFNPRILARGWYLMGQHRLWGP